MYKAKVEKFCNKAVVNETLIIWHLIYINIYQSYEETF